MKYLKFVVLSLVVSGVAFAVAQSQAGVDAVNSSKPQWFQQGFYTGTLADGTLSDVKNKQATHLCGTKVYDFPSLKTGGTTATVCAASSSLTITGCGFNDRISLGVDQTRINEFGTIQAYVSAANTLVVQACGVGITDGGAFDMPDASYTVCCDGY